MKNSDVIICVLMPKYELGEGLPFTQYLDIPVNVYGVRKKLEHLGLNMIDFMLVKINQSTPYYGLAVDLENSKFETADEVMQDVCSKLNIEYDQYKLAEIFNDVMTKNRIN